MKPATNQSIVCSGRRYAIRNVNDNGVFWNTPELQMVNNLSEYTYDDRKKAWFRDVKGFMHWEAGDHIRLIGKPDVLTVYRTSADHQTVGVITTADGIISSGDYPMEIFEEC